MAFLPNHEYVAPMTCNAINRYYQDVWAGRSVDSAELFSELPRQLQSVAARDAAGRLLESASLFQGIQAEARSLLASKMRPVDVPIGSECSFHWRGMPCLANNGCKFIEITLH
eukprot:scaffold2009_cov33-Prasinocladus_malaysianus.AAC.1